MTRLLPRMPRRRAERDAAPAPPTAPATDAAATGAPATDGAATGTDVADQPTTVAADAPAATEPVAPDRPGFRERSRLRRRLQYLRRVRELGFRDLGGLVFDQHRFDRRDESLVRAKLDALGAVDRELRAIEHALAEDRPITELREVGVSACARCGALVGSDARFCSACGAPARGARDVAAVVTATAGIAPPAPGEPPPAAAPPEPAGATPLAARLGAWAGAGEQRAAVEQPTQPLPAPDAADADAGARADRPGAEA